jgi:hypothetical protein
MEFASLYRASQLALGSAAHDLPSFWRLLGDGTTEIRAAYYAFMQQRCVLNQLVSLGLHIAENDMSTALVLAYRLNSATQQLCIAFRDAFVVPALWEAKYRCETIGDVEGPAMRAAFRVVCSEVFEEEFSGSLQEDLMLLAVDKMFRSVELRGDRLGQQVIRPFSSQNVERQRSRRRRHGRGRTDRSASRSGME